MEQDGHIEVWNRCLDFIEKNIGSKEKFDTWFKPLKSVSLSGSTLTVEVPSNFFIEFIEGAYLPLLSSALRMVIGDGAKLLYRTRPVQTQPAMVLPVTSAAQLTNKTVAVNVYPTEGNPGPFVFPGLKRIQINPRLKIEYNFDNLVEGECNRLGISAGMAIADKPGDNPFNPFFIFGAPGLGKTHLAQAIGIRIKEKYPDLVVLYITGNEFKTQYMDAVNVRNKLTDFLAFYMRIDVLIVDDVQDLLGQGSQNAFFNVFDHLHKNGRQLVFTSDRPSRDLQNFEARLLSRFKWGLSVELEKPAYEVRFAMLRAKAFREGVQVSDEVLAYISSKIRSSFRELEGAFVSLVAHATLSHRELNVALAESVTSSIAGETLNKITVDRIRNAVCDYFNLTKEDLLSKCRKRLIVQARQIAMYLCRNMINCSLSTIGAEIGGKDHATVVHACNIVSDLMSTDRLFKQYVIDIEKMLTCETV